MTKFTKGLDRLAVTTSCIIMDNLYILQIHASQCSRKTKCFSKTKKQDEPDLPVGYVDNVAYYKLLYVVSGSVKCHVTDKSGVRYLRIQ